MSKGRTHLRKEKIMEIAKGVTVDPKVCFGKPVIKGTRISVELIVGNLAGGMSFDEIISEYGITKEAILNALNYASTVLSSEEIRAVG